MDNLDFKAIPIHRWKNGEYTAVDDPVAEEIFLRVFVNDSIYGSLVCSPWNLEELVIGYLYCDGVITANEEVESLTIQGNTATVRLCASPRQFRSAVSPPLQSLTPAAVTSLVHMLEDDSTLFRHTGGVHTAALSDGMQFLCRCEDVGRHNALDRLIGRCLMQGISMAGMIIVFSGRVPDEIIRKAAQVSAAVLVSVSAPTTLAIQTAQEQDITLICFARENRFNVYTHPERLALN